MTSDEFPNVPYQKKEALAEFRAVAEADSKLHMEAQYIDPLWASQHNTAGWPNKGGPKNRYYYKEFPDGTSRLVADPNTPYCNTDYIEVTGGMSKHRNKYEEKGFRQLSHAELLGVVDAQQRWHLERWEAREAPEPIEAAKPKRGRPAKAATL